MVDIKTALTIGEEIRKEYAKRMPKKYRVVEKRIPAIMKPYFMTGNNPKKRFREEIVTPKHKIPKHATYRYRIVNGHRLLIAYWNKINKKHKKYALYKILHPRRK